MDGGAQPAVKLIETFPLMWISRISIDNLTNSYKVFHFKVFFVKNFWGFKIILTKKKVKKTSKIVGVLLKCVWKVNWFYQGAIILISN